MRYLICCQVHGWIGTYSSTDSEQIESIASEAALRHRLELHPSIDGRKFDGEIIVSKEVE